MRLTKKHIGRALTRGSVLRRMKLRWTNLSLTRSIISWLMSLWESNLHRRIPVWLQASGQSLLPTRMWNTLRAVQILQITRPEIAKTHPVLKKWREDVVHSMRLMQAVPHLVPVARNARDSAFPMKVCAVLLQILPSALRILYSSLYQEINKIIQNRQHLLILADSYSLVMKNKEILYCHLKPLSFLITANWDRVSLHLWCFLRDLKWDLWQTLQEISLTKRYLKERSLNQLLISQLSSKVKLLITVLSKTN